MKDSVFLDTNILIYAYSKIELDKKVIVTSLINSYYPCNISTQIVSEFINTMHHKRKIPCDWLHLALEAIMRHFIIKPITFSTFEIGLDVGHRYKFSWYDSLIVAAALENDCTMLVTEDLQHGQKIGNQLTIVNPFKL